jgi:hypothetical protein
MTKEKNMFEMNLVLLDVEVQDLVNVLGQLPTQSGAFMLYQKIAMQLEKAREENKPTEPPQEE